jgi:hypothetical protein
MDIESLVDLWRAAETKLYPMVVVSPHQYEVNLRLVRAMTKALSGATTVEALAAAYDQGQELLAKAVQDSGAAAPSTEVAPLLIGAAFQGRYRELPGERQHKSAIDAIHAAGDRRGWVTLGESGDDGPNAGAGFRRIEIHLPDGMGMHTYIDIDATTFMPLYGLELLQLDPGTGEFAGDEARPVRCEFADRDEWLQAIAVRKSQVESA